jgi:hypothetical protein
MVSPMPGMRNSHARIAHDVTQRVDAVVAATVRDHEGVAVHHAHETFGVAARRAIEPLGAARCQDEERRRFDERPIVVGDVVDLLDLGGLDGFPVDGIEFFQRRDLVWHGHLRVRPNTA